MGFNSAFKGLNKLGLNLITTVYKENSASKLTYKLDKV